MNDNLSPADISAVVGNTDRNNGYAYPVFPYGGGFGYGNSFGGDGSWIWIILILALFGGFNGNGNGFGGFNNDYAWLSNGQKDIMTNTNNGFNTLHLSDQVEGVRDGIYGLANQICNSTADVTSAVTNGFYGAEISANNRAVNQMQDTWALSRQLGDASADNRLGQANLTSTILAENCADRAALQEGVRDIITASQNNTQRIIDEIFRDRLDEKDSKIDELNRQIQLAELKASQIAQTDAITRNIYNELKNCPVGTVPVFRKSTDIHLFKQCSWMRMWKHIWNNISLIAKSLIRQTR